MIAEAKAFFMTGTDTGVGKTIVTAALCREARRDGLRVQVMKPFASGSWDDTRQLKAASASKATLQEITPVFYRTPAATWAASLKEGKSWDWKSVDKAFVARRQEGDVLLIEGIGGALVPLEARCSVADLIARWNLPAIVVTRWGLGTLNHTMLTLEVLRKRKIAVAGLIANQTQRGRPGFVEKTNLEYLRKESGVPVLATMRYASAANRRKLVWENAKPWAGPNRLS